MSDVRDEIDETMQRLIVEAPMVDVLERLEKQAFSVLCNLRKGDRAYRNAAVLHQCLKWMLEGAIREQTLMDEPHRSAAWGATQSPSRTGEG